MGFPVIFKSSVRHIAENAAVHHFTLSGNDSSNLLLVEGLNRQTGAHNSNEDYYNQRWARSG
jgi:hypothetical protein